MPVAGLVVTLVISPHDADAAQCAIAGDQRFEVGPRHGRRLPVVFATADDETSRALHAHLEHLHGVDHVDVVFVETDAPETVMATNERG